MSNNVITQNAVNWFELYTSDFARAKTFYETIFQSTLTDASAGDMKMAIFPYHQEAGVGGSLTQMEGCQPGPGGTVIYLNAEGDLDGIISRIPDAGGKIIKPRMAIPPHGFIAVFEDSEGNVVGLHSMS